MAPKKEMPPSAEYQKDCEEKKTETGLMIDELAELVDGICKKSGNPVAVSSKTSPGKISEIKDMVSESRGKIREMKAGVGSAGELWSVLDALDFNLSQMLDGNESVVPSRVPYLIGTLKNKCIELAKFKRGAGIK